MNSTPPPIPQQRLTHKNIKAVRHFLLHGNKTAAYKDAYDTDGMQPQTIVRKANILFNEPKIVAEVMQQQMKLAERFEIKAEDLQKFLLGVARRCMKEKIDKQGNRVPTAPGVSVSAIAELNRMIGYHAPPGGRPPSDDDRPVIDISPEDYKLVRTQMIVEDDV